jgi:hypothetical protein
MRQLNDLVLLVATMAALPIAPVGANAEQCALDRITFVDAKSGNKFVAKRVAVSYQYECASGWTKEFDHPSKGFKDCRGPFGDTIIEGTLSGHKAFAVYTVSDALPCCVWYSYSVETASSEPAIGQAKWLPHKEAPSIELDDALTSWYTIGEENPPYDPDKGPMGGGEYVPKLCRR